MLPERGLGEDRPHAARSQQADDYYDQAQTKKRIAHFEFSLIAGVNDTRQDFTPGPLLPNAAC